jgi:hypothetical protein
MTKMAQPKAGISISVIPVDTVSNPANKQLQLTFNISTITHSMKNNLTDKDTKWLTCSANTIAKLDRNGLEEKELRRMIYQLGVFFYRNYHGVGLPADFTHPSLLAPKKVWDKTSQRFVDERELVVV